MSLSATLRKAEPIRDFPEADEFPIQPGQAGTYQTETYNLWVYDPVQEVGLNIWFASSDNSFPNFLSTVIVYDRGERWLAKAQGQGNPPHGIGGGSAFLNIAKPYKRLEISFLGLLAPHQTPRKAEDALDPFGGAPADGLLGRIDLVVDIVTPPIEQGSQGDRGLMASSGTIPRTAIRYEQLCRVTGPVRIGDRTIDIEAFGMRSHRRNSASIYASGAVGHTWATALFPSGRGFHLLSYQVEPDASVGFLYGHYFDGRRYHEAEVARFPYYSGSLTPETYELELRVQSKPIRLRVETQPPLTSDIPPTDVLLTRSPGRFTLDGEIGGGVLERSLSRRFKFGGEFTL